MRWFCCCLSIAVAVAVSASTARAQLTSPQIGWVAELNTYYHNVTGTVSILDPNTLQIDDFTYDGGGPAVYFYLGSEDSQFDFPAEQPIGMLLSGNMYDGTQESFTVDLPVGETMEGWNAISVWCADFNVNFGSGPFQAVDPMGDFDKDGDADGDDFLLWQRDPNVGSLASWEANYGPGTLLSASSTAVPEPATWLALLLGMMVVFFRRDAVVF